MSLTSNIYVHCSPGLFPFPLPTLGLTCQKSRSPKPGDISLNTPWIYSIESAPWQSLHSCSWCLFHWSFICLFVAARVHCGLTCFTVTSDQLAEEQACPDSIAIAQVNGISDPCQTCCLSSKSNSQRLLFLIIPHHQWFTPNKRAHPGNFNGRPR